MAKERKGRIAIAALRLIDPQSGRILCPRRWQYATELSRLLVELGYAVAWYQLGAGGLFDIFPGVPLVASLPEESQLYTWPQASNEFWENAGAADFAIYYDVALAYPQVHKTSIAVVHGIDWNDPLKEAHLQSEREREEWKRRLWMAMQGPRRVVAVDSGVIQWATATWPGLFHQFVHIPDFVPTNNSDRVFDGVSDEILEDVPANVPGDRPGVVDLPEADLGTLRIVFWDDLTPRSGIAQVLEAVDPLLDRYKHVGMAIAGRGRPDTETFISRWAGERERVTYEPEGIGADLLRQCILLLPGKWGVGPSFHCLEGMAAGAAVVVGQTSGLTDLVLHDYNGWVIQPTVDGIRKALVALIEKPDERRRLGQNAHDMASAFSLDVWRRRWCELIASEFEGKGSRQ